MKICIWGNENVRGENEKIPYTDFQSGYAGYFKVNILKPP
jgi:hypothetical protein